VSRAGVKACLYKITILKMKRIKELSDFILYKLYKEGKEGLVDLKYELLKVQIVLTDQQFKLLVAILENSELVKIQSGKYSKRISFYKGKESFATISSISNPGKSIVDIFEKEKQKII